MSLHLLPFQVKGVQWLRSRRAGLLGDDMGTGKSVQTVMAIPDDYPAIITCPASMKGIWRVENLRWRPERRVVVLYGRGNFMWPRPGETIITNYDILPEKPPKGAPKRLVVVADEATAVKSNKTRRHKAFKCLARAATLGGGHAWLLTGTPLINNPYELWNMLLTCGLETQAFGGFGKFMWLFNASQGQFGIEYGAPRPEVRDCLNKVMLRRTKSQVLPELPTVFPPKDVPVDIPDDVREVCDRAQALLKEHGIDLEGALDNVSDTALSGAEFDEIARARQALAVAKIPALLEFVESFEEAGEPVVVFSCHRAPVDVLGQRKGWGRISGDDSEKTRTAAIQSFQRGELNGIAITIQAGGMGITLTRACNAIFVDQAWTPAMNAQARDRLCRIGQTRGVLITRFVAAHALDERVNVVLDRKSTLISDVIDTGPVSVGMEDFELTESNRAPLDAFEALA